MEELKDEKVNDNYKLVWKNKIYAKTYVQILITFHYVILIFNQ